MKKQSNDEIWNYQQIDLGFNYRINDIQAALGLNQMKRIDGYIKLRHKIANFYNNELKDLPITLPWQKPRFYSSYHLYPILIKTEKNFKSQKQVFNELRKNKIGVNLHYIPIHRHPYYEDLNFKYGDFPVAEKFHQEALSIPIFPTLQEEELDYVVSVLRKVLIK